jgi:hypothetical protein
MSTETQLDRIEKTVNKIEKNTDVIQSFQALNHAEQLSAIFTAGSNDAKLNKAQTQKLFSYYCDCLVTELLKKKLTIMYIYLCVPKKGARAEKDSTYSTTCNGEYEVPPCNACIAGKGKFCEKTNERSCWRLKSLNHHVDAAISAGRLPLAGFNDWVAYDKTVERSFKTPMKEKGSASGVSSAAEKTSGAQKDTASSAKGKTSAASAAPAFSWTHANIMEAFENFSETLVKDLDFMEEEANATSMKKMWKDRFLDSLTAVKNKHMLETVREVDKFYDAASEFGELVSANFFEGQRTFFVIAYGQKGSGKSVLARYLIKNEYEGLFDRVIVFSATAEANQAYNYLPSDDVYTEYVPSVVIDLVAAQSAIPEDARPYVLIVFDDCIGMNKFTGNEPELQQLYSANRHYRISLFFSTQKPKFLPPLARANADFSFIFRTANSVNIKSLFDEIGNMEKFSQFSKFVKESTQDYNILMYIRNDQKYKVVRVPHER